MTRAKIKTLKKRIEAINKKDIATIHYYENGEYKELKMKYNEAQKLALEQIEANL